MADHEDLIPELDKEFLKEKGYVFKILPRGDFVDVVIDDFTFPSYSPKVASLLIQLPAGYPNTALDMFWTYPDVKCADGNWPKACEHHETYHEKSWQRWSRHGTWRAGIDSLRTYISTIKAEISKGI